MIWRNDALLLAKSVVASQNYSVHRSNLFGSRYIGRLVLCMQSSESPVSTSTFSIPYDISFSSTLALSLDAGKGGTRSTLLSDLPGFGVRRTFQHVSVNTLTCTVSRPPGVSLLVSVCVVPGNSPAGTFSDTNATLLPTAQTCTFLSDSTAVGDHLFSLEFGSTITRSINCTEPGWAPPALFISCTNIGATKSSATLYIHGSARCTVTNIGFLVPA